VNAIANILKYFSMNSRMGSPYLVINPAIRKNRALLLTILANINKEKLTWNAPALIVNSLNGIGVNPAVKTIIKLYSSYNPFILSKP